MRFPKPKTFVSDELEQQLRRSHVYAPSRPDPWFGGWAPGSALSGNQLAELARRGLDPEAAPRLEVHVCVPAAKLYVPIGQRQPWRRIPCPIVGQRGERLLVIAPNGERKLVYPTGDVRRPWDWGRPRADAATPADSSTPTLKGEGRHG